MKLIVMTSYIPKLHTYVPYNGYILRVQIAANPNKSASLEILKNVKREVGIAIKSKETSS